MKKCIGTKLINAEPMTRLAYNILRGWELPQDENGNDDGYLVEYLDGGQSNHADYAGYISWSPKAVFENAYRPVTGMSFGLAVEALKLGKKVCRTGWNGKGMWLIYVNPIGQGINDEAPYYKVNHVGDYRLLPWIGMKTADNKFVPWLASQTDVLADDWMILEDSDL